MTKLVSELDEISKGLSAEWRGVLQQQIKSVASSPAQTQGLIDALVAFNEAHPGGSKDFQQDLKRLAEKNKTVTPEDSAYGVERSEASSRIGNELEHARTEINEKFAEERRAALKKTPIKAKKHPASSHHPQPNRLLVRG